MNDAIMIIIMKNCNDFQVHRCIECMRELEAVKDQGSSRLQCVFGEAMASSSSVSFWLRYYYLAKTIAFFFIQNCFKCDYGPYSRLAFGSTRITL